MLKPTNRAPTKMAVMANGLSIGQPYDRMRALYALSSAPTPYRQSEHMNERDADRADQSDYEHHEA